MDKFNQPTKEQIRHYMQQRRLARRPPPSMKEIRRLLGWVQADTMVGQSIQQVRE